MKKLDLHGLTLDEAFDEFTDFIYEAYINNLPKAYESLEIPKAIQIDPVTINEIAYSIDGTTISFNLVDNAELQAVCDIDIKCKNKFHNGRRCFGRNICCTTAVKD